MTELDLEAIEGRASAATAGPWEDFSDTTGDGQWILGRAESPDEGYHGTLDVFELRYSASGEAETNGITAADLDFIVNARTDIPALVTEVRRHREREAAVRALHTPAVNSVSALFPVPACGGCDEDYPCATLLALGGD